MGRVGEIVGSSGGRCVCGLRRRGVRSRTSLQCGAQPGAEATIRLCGLAHTRLALVAMDCPAKFSVFTAVLGRKWGPAGTSCWRCCYCAFSPNRLRTVPMRRVGPLHGAK